MNTLIEIATTIQPLKARHSPAVELLCLSWERSCVQTGHTHLEKCTHKNKNHYSFTTHFGQLLPDLLINTCTELHTPPSIKKSQTSFHTTHTSLSHNPSLRYDFTMQTVSLSFSVFCFFFSLAFLSVFMDQWREQLHQRRSGGLEMKSCVAVGKHLAAVRGAEQDQEEKKARGGGEVEEEEEMQRGQMCCRFFGLWGDLEAQCELGVEF